MRQDGKIDIAVGMSAKSKTWKNQKWKWSDLAEKLTTEQKTNETFKEFISASKEDQSKIKDVGGYVGGYLRNGRRKPENVIHRQLLTLDVDEAHNNFWGDFTMQFDNAAVLHATHKHTEKDPRYRLVMPLSRECTPDEYVATARYIAGVLGIGLFDNTTFQCERLMFWPSNPKDTEYRAYLQQGQWIDVDDILNSYVDWTDSSTWPTSESVVRLVRNDSKKQEDPETKKGVVGAFCRTYSISSAIAEFLTEEYSPAGNSRYTYAKGTAAAGLTVYEDKFAYSHHGTDPCSGKLCNAFDLVRVHKFGHLDATTQYSNAKSKSFMAMEDFCRSNGNVKKTIATENIINANYDFAEEIKTTEQSNTDWAIGLEVDGKGKYVSSANNISLIFSSDPRIKNAFHENVFDNKKYVVKSLPWRSIKKPEAIKNVDYSGVRNYIESIYGISGAMKIEDALNLEFEKNIFHPVKGYLNSLEWDHIPRIDTLLIDYFGADDNVYTREAIRKTLVAAVARVFNPGVKFDLVLTLVGKEQGTGKSTFFAKLGKDWFSDSFHTVSGKESFEQLQGAWIIEMAELSGIKKSEVESTKHFITKREDSFRPAYGRTVETFKRQCVFVASTNEEDFLRDSSGNRRFMPIEVNNRKNRKNILDEHSLVGQELNQIWAEAVALYKDEEPLYLSSKAEKLAKDKQGRHSQKDEREGIIEEFLNRTLPDDWGDKDIYERRLFLQDPISSKGTQKRQYVCVAEVWCECLEREKHDMDRYKTREINEILRSLENWEKVNSTKIFKLYGKQKYYKRK